MSHTFEYTDMPMYDKAHRDAVSLRMAPLRTKHVRSPADTRVSAAMDELLANRERNLTAPESEMRMGLLIVGASGAGKSRIVRKRIEPRPDLAAEPPPLEAQPFVSVKLQAPVLLRSMGFQTRQAQGYALAKMVEKDSQWPDVSRRIEALKTRVIHYDEAQDVFLTANRNDVKNIRSAWKSLMTHTSHPVVLVLSGTMDLKPYMEADVQERRRFIRVELSPISFTSHFDEVRGYLDAYCKQAEIANQLEPEDYERLIHAADSQFGWTYARALDGIAEAISAGDAALRRVHLAHAYERAGNFDAALNIFVVDYWRKLIPDAGLAEDILPQQRRSRPRKETAF